MISETDRATILKYAKRYNVSEVYLFGSSIEREDAANIDIGIRGILPELFLTFMGNYYLSFQSL